MSEMDASSVLSHASSVSQLDQYIRDQGLEEGPPVSAVVTKPGSMNLDNLLGTPSSAMNNLSALADNNASFGVTTSVKKRASADQSISVLSAATATPKNNQHQHQHQHLQPLTLDSYLGTDDDDSDSDDEGNQRRDGNGPKSALSVSDDSFHELNASARQRTASYNMRSMEDVKRKKLNYPPTKLHDAHLIQPLENRDETNADQIEGQAMDRLATSYGPVVRSSLLNSASQPPSTDPDAILRRLRDQHNLRRRSLKSLVDLNYDLDEPEGGSDSDGGGSYGYANESMSRGNLDDLDDSFEVERGGMAGSNPKRINLAKVNASIQEVLRTRSRGSRGGTLVKAITSGGVGSPGSVDSEVEVEIKRSREVAEQQQAIMEEQLQQAKEKEQREEQERKEEEQRLEQEEGEKANLTNWILYFDETNQHHYYFNPVTEESLWQEDAPQEVVQAVAEKETGMAQAASMATPPPKPPASPLPQTSINMSPLPLFSPTKLIRNFNESYGIPSATPHQQRAMAKPHDPLSQVASTLQEIVSQFAEFSQTQQSHFEQQRREQQRASLNSTINLSLARPAVGQFEDLDEGEDEAEVTKGEGSEMGDITGVSAIAQQGEDEPNNSTGTSNSNSNSNDPPKSRERAQTEPAKSSMANKSTSFAEASGRGPGPRGFSSPPLRKGRGRANPIPPPQPIFGKKDPNAPPIIEIVEPDPNPPLLTKILSQKTLPQYEQVENELVKEEWIKEAGGVGSGVCSGTQTEYDSAFDEGEPAELMVDKVMTARSVSSSTQVSPVKGVRGSGRGVVMVDARTGVSPEKSAKKSKKKSTSATSTDIYVSPSKLQGARTIAFNFKGALMRFVFAKWRIVSIPPTPITTAPVAVNPKTAKLEEVGENCIFALRSRISSSNTVLVSVDEGSSLMPPSPSADTPMLSMLVEEGKVSERVTEKAAKFSPMKRVWSEEVAPTRVVKGFERSEYEEPEKEIDFSGMGLYVPSSMSVGGGEQRAKASSETFSPPRRSSASVGPGTAARGNSLMPLEYQRALSGLKARYGSLAPAESKTFGTGGAIEPKFHLAIPPPPKSPEPKEGEAVGDVGLPVFGSMSVKIADLTVEGLFNKDQEVRQEIMKGREDLRSTSVEKRVVDKARIMAAGVEAKNSIKWLSSPPSSKKAGGGAGGGAMKADEEEEGSSGLSPRRSFPSRSLTFRSPLRSLSSNYLPPSSTLFEGRDSVEALSDLKNKIKSVEDDLKSRKLGMAKDGGFDTRKMKGNLEDIKNRRLEMRTGGIAKPIKRERGSDFKGAEQTLFSPDFNFATALVRNIQAPRPGSDVNAKKLIKLVASPPDKHGRFKLKTEKLGDPVSYNVKTTTEEPSFFGPIKTYNFGFLEDKDGEKGYGIGIGGGGLKEDDVSTITRGD
ncbi:hypothetical protein TrVE_jg3729 [Triparma verrucosa]|uniref:WW domain-containing protein n=1 Tax=Triparma verrucosa TaxID=1606542 RepID=A0A9W7BAZ5_9STRA|nr:hypothetical protein TrVE_jg3729 [Triparma verrucosa]